MHEMSLEKQGSEGCLKCKLSRVVQTKEYINRRSGPVDIYSSEGSPQTTNILIVGAAQLIYIHRRVVH